MIIYRKLLKNNNGDSLIDIIEEIINKFEIRRINIILEI